MIQQLNVDSELVADVIGYNNSSSKVNFYNVVEIDEFVRSLPTEELGDILASLEIAMSGVNERKVEAMRNAQQVETRMMILRYYIDLVKS